MIAELRGQLLQTQEKWRPPGSSSTPKVGALKSRLSALTQSADEWKRRVQKEEIASPNARRNSNVLQVKTSTTQSQTPSKAAVLHSVDSGLATFFPSLPASVSVTASEKQITSTDVLDQLKVSSDRLSTPRRAPPPRGRRGVRPPSNRLCELERVQVEKQAGDDRGHGFDKVILEDDDDEDVAQVALSAKKGLQAVEDYNSTKSALKKCEIVSPFPELMLIRVKGERKVDVRLVLPSAESVHQRACFVLVTPQRLLLYIGDESNILERTKANEICAIVTQKHDLSCGASQVERFEGSAPTFFRLLNGENPGEEPDLPLEAFENIVNKVNVVYRVTEDCDLQTVVRGDRARFTLLQSTQVLIFDFGSEIYVWSGRASNKRHTRAAMKYVEQMAKKGVSCRPSIFGCALDGPRPGWTIQRRVFQGVQDILFASKFYDWQTSENKHKWISAPKPKNTPMSSRDCASTAAYLGQELRELEHPQQGIVLEDMFIHRDTKDLITESIKFWILRGEQLKEIESTTVLLSNQCYVIRWQYRFQLSGVRRLKDGSANDKETGRSRVAYFYWLGQRTTAKVQGICSLKLSHMDKEKHAHVRVVQGEECDAFLMLFSGKLIIRDEEDKKDRRFLIRGSSPTEMCAEEVEDTELRSHAVYIVLQGGNGTFVQGPNSNKQDVDAAKILLNEMLQAGIVKSTTEEASSSMRSWITAEERSRTPRFYRIVEATGDEIPSLLWNARRTVAFPHKQSVLRDNILVDAGNILWVWTEEPPTLFVLKTAEAFWKDRKGECRAVEKCGEPSEFKALFPQWNEWADEKENEGQGTSTPSPVRPVSDCIRSLTRTFTPEQLRARTDLPPGIDLTRLEAHLSDTDFGKVFGMARDQFEHLPQWKQTRLRKEHGLF